MTHNSLEAGMIGDNPVVILFGLSAELKKVLLIEQMWLL